MGEVEAEFEVAMILVLWKLELFCVLCVLKLKREVVGSPYFRPIGGMDIYHMQRSLKNC